MPTTLAPRAQQSAGPVARAYERLIQAGELRPDPDQAAAVAELDRLATSLGRAHPKPGLLQRLFRGVSPTPPPCGVYLWGGVGRGKSMLMDLFHGQVAFRPKRRAHYHAFMADVHARIHAAREGEQADPVPAVARALARQASLLCLDEFHVTDVADAMILSRLFTALFAQGVVLVTTSNRPPQDLYKDGLNRELFLPFIDLIQNRLRVVALNGPTDYRLARLQGMPTYYVPNGPEATRALSEAFFRLTDFPIEDRARVPVATLAVGHGRKLVVPKSLKGVAVFSFKRLCMQPLGAADYLAIARAYHTIILVGVPRMGPERRNEAARFVTLIDTLYESRCKLLIAADAPPHELYTEGTGAFEFERTASRLVEMQSAQYWARGHCT